MWQLCWIAPSACEVGCRAVLPSRGHCRIPLNDRSVALSRISDGTTLFGVGLNGALDQGVAKLRPRPGRRDLTMIWRRLSAYEKASFKLKGEKLPKALRAQEELQGGARLNTTTSAGSRSQ